MKFRPRFERYLFLSFSSFAVSAALLSKEVKVLYRRIGVEWESVLHANLMLGLGGARRTEVFSIMVKH
eukprot:s2260_g11.t1